MKSKSVKGIGTDICAINRVDELLKKQGEKFVERILSAEEIETKGGVEGLLEDASFMARRFAAKEAISKALGTGIGAELSFHDMTIIRKGNQRPVVKFSDDRFDGLDVHLSISDEQDYALAFAVVAKTLEQAEEADVADEADDVTESEVEVVSYNLTEEETSEDVDNKREDA